MVFKHNKSCPYYNVKLSYIFLRFTERKEKQRLRIRFSTMMNRKFKQTIIIHNYIELDQVQICTRHFNVVQQHQNYSEISIQNSSRCHALCLYAICLITLLVSLAMDIVAIRFIVLVLCPILRQSLLPLLGTASAMFRKLES